MQFDNTIPTTGQKGRNRFIMTFDTIRQSDKNGVSAVDDNDDDNDDKLIRMVLMMIMMILMMILIVIAMMINR
ncbi:hypothetical protein M8J77_003378 [Diaphorina citri]|nr:hypothetical protein M8J77_003378 [Diaphorina citri]